MHLKQNKTEGHLRRTFVECCRPEEMSWFHPYLIQCGEWTNQDDTRNVRSVFWDTFLILFIHELFFLLRFPQVSMSSAIVTSDTIYFVTVFFFLCYHRAYSRGLLPVSFLTLFTVSVSFVSFILWLCRFINRYGSCLSGS